ncbi:MAG: hypothetical protein AB7K09_23120 [Planctomycetota bacterium]
MPEDGSDDMVGVKERRQGRKPTADEVLERIELAEWCLARMMAKSAIKKLFRKRYGDLAARTIERYLSRARSGLLDRINRRHSDVMADVLAGYEAIVADPESPRDTRLKALDSIRDMLGLKLPSPKDADERDERAKSILSGLLGFMKFERPAGESEEPEDGNEDVALSVPSADRVGGNGAH